MKSKKLEKMGKEFLSLKTSGSVAIRSCWFGPEPPGSGKDSMTKETLSGDDRGSKQ